MKKRMSWTWACALSPWVVALILIAMAVHVRLGLGHWPTPMTESYTSAAFTLHEITLVVVGLFAFYGAVPLYLSLLLLRKHRVTPQFHFKQAAVYISGWAIIFLLGAADPTTFTEWLLD